MQLRSGGFGSERYLRAIAQSIGANEDMLRHSLLGMAEAFEGEC